jgi:hypothetical protein
MFALPTCYVQFFLGIDFFSGNQACPYQLTAGITNELNFCDAVVVLEDFKGRKLFSCFVSFFVCH